MNCEEIVQALLDGSMTSPSLSEAEEHLRGCARCQRLVGTPGTLIPGASPATLRHIERGIVADLRPVNPIAPNLYVFAAFIAIFVSFVAVGVFRMGAFAFAVITPFQAGLILSALASGAALLAYSLVNQMIPGSRHRIPPGLLPFAITISLAIAIALLFHFQHERHFSARAWGCVRAGTPIGVLAAIPLWFVLRRGAVLSPAMTGAAAGLLAGLAGTTVLEIHCPNLDAWHILASHLGVAVLCAITGLILGFFAENRRNIF